MEVTDNVAEFASGNRRVAAFFDLDKAVIAKPSTLAFSRQFYQGGLLNRGGVLKGSYAQFLLLLHGADQDQIERMRRHLAGMCAGWDVAQVRSIVAETLHEVVDPLMYVEAADLIADHKIRSHDIVVLSASGEELVVPIAAAIGADHTAASRMVIENGKYTGGFDFYCHGENKALAMTELADRYGYELDRCYAYSDSIGDLPMLEIVGHPTVVNPDRALRQEALERGWPILTFANPVSLTTRIPTPPPAVTVSAAVVVASALGAAVLTYNLLRRRG